MNSRALTIVVVLVAVVAVVGLVWWWSTPVTAPTATPSPTNEFQKLPGDTSTNQFLQQAPGDEVPSTAPTSASPSPAASTAASVTIVVDETGFSPAAVTVTPGTKVTFVNNGQAPHWPASDVHPTHNILPEFDAKRGLATGEEYSFTFTKAGTWRFHDHLRAQSTGTVTVR
jgi:plastocyanin